MQWLKIPLNKEVDKMKVLQKTRITQRNVSKYNLVIIAVWCLEMISKRYLYSIFNILSKIDLIVNRWILIKSKKALSKYLRIIYSQLITSFLTKICVKIFFIIWVLNINYCLIKYREDNNLRWRKQEALKEICTYKLHACSCK